MTKKRAIAARDHRAGVTQQRFDGVARGGCLPFFAIERAESEYDLRDLLLGRAGVVAIEGLEHPSQSRPLLAGQACVRWNSAAMEGSEQAADGFNLVEPIKAERHKRAERLIRRPVGGVSELDMLAVAEIVEQVGLAVSGNGNGGVNRRLLLSACGNDSGRLAEDDCACVLVGEPEHRRFGRRLQRVHREIATPTAAESCRSADADQPSSPSGPGNPCRSIRCGGAIPTRGRMRSCHRHDRSPWANASPMHLVSSRSSPGLSNLWESQDSRLGCSTEVRQTAKGDAEAASR